MSGKSWGVGRSTDDQMIVRVIDVVVDTEKSCCRGERFICGFES
jgi:hypothetical protein